MRVGIFPCTVRQGRGEQKSPWCRVTKKRKLTEDSGQIELNLETDVDVRSVDRRGPPQCETTIRDLTESGTLSVRQFFVLHRFL